MRRLVICADGTWNEPEQVDSKTGRRHPTNVLKVARAVLPIAANGNAQIVYYHEGVGTGNNLDKWTGGAFGDGIEENVRSLYRFLVFNYNPDDELYFFGFSRGAFTVRKLAGFMNTVGLLEKGDEFYTPELYRLYQTSAPLNSEAWKQAFHHVRNPRPTPTIRFIGVWDTVGSLGAPGVIGRVFNRNKYKYHDLALHPTMLNVYQALAIDERRRPFAPSVIKRPNGWAGTLEQAWFAGVHCNVGGSYDPDGLANEPLHWMVEKAERLGLEFDTAFLDHYLPCFNSELRDSMSLKYKLFGPYMCPIGEHEADGEAIHQSVLDRRNLPECKYDPPNLRLYLAQNSPQVVNTTRIARGTPCPPWKPTG